MKTPLNDGIKIICKYHKYFIKYIFYHELHNDVNKMLNAMNKAHFQC